MAALGTARYVIEKCPGWHIVSIQIDTRDRTYRRYHLTICHDPTGRLAGAMRYIYSLQDWATFLREIGRLAPQPGTEGGNSEVAR
jgi:hypothetical protein